MLFVEWEPEFSVGIKRFDDDHRHLFSLFNQLHEPIAAHDGNLALTLIMRELVWYAQTHFKAEEVLMKLYRYPEFVSHRAEHDHFAEQVLQFVDHFDSGRDEVIVEVSDTLQEWLAQMLRSDAAYAKFFQLHDAAEVRSRQRGFTLSYERPALGASS